MGKESEKEWIYIYICRYIERYIDIDLWINHLAVNLKLTHFKSTIIQTKHLYIHKCLCVYIYI